MPFFWPKQAVEIKAFYSLDYNLYDRNCSSDVVIPKKIEGTNVLKVGNFAFFDDQLTSVVIPDSVTSIGYDAFDPETKIIRE